MKAFITRKIGMTSVVEDSGAVKAVTLLSAGNNVITQIKSDETDGYQALQLGFETSKNIAKPQIGHNKPSKASPNIIHEFRLKDATNSELSVGQEISADVFSVGDSVQVTGTTKGKGFAGTIKRHNMRRGRKTHGGRSYRRPGSIGSMYPQKIFKGKRMAGRMGHVTVTTKNLKVALVDTDLGVIGVNGSVPGPRKGLILIQENK